MRRVRIRERPDWRGQVERLGLLWHSDQEGNPYWNEAAYYEFSKRQADEITAASETLHELFLRAGQYIIDNRRFEPFAIPAWAIPLIIQAWNDEPPALNHGRFDLGYDGRSPPKLFEYNCDTPTSMFEAAIVQWRWREAVRPFDRQCNDLHEWLVWKWGDIKPGLRGRKIHFTHVDDVAGEDTITVTYLRDTALEAGIESAPILIQDIGWDPAARRFVDLDDLPIDALFHLYPWEWLVREGFGEHIAESYASTLWIEPIWKMIWSNKAILPILWELFPGHPNLLPAFFERPAVDHVRKPKLGREGANVTIVRQGQSPLATDGAYGDEGFVYQAYYEMPEFDGWRPVIGSWMVDGHAAGIGVREGGEITDNLGRFTPHVVGG